MQRMKHYRRTEIVTARSMTLGQAETILNQKFNTSAVENPEQTLGYLVEYGDHRTWIQKEDFERLYAPCETPIDRMYIEKQQVSDRYICGRSFSFTQQFQKISESERSLLRQQLDAMERYIYILSRRIEMAERNLTKAPSESPSTSTSASPSVPLPYSLFGKTVRSLIKRSCDTCGLETPDCCKLHLAGDASICIGTPNTPERP